MAAGVGAPHQDAGAPAKHSDVGDQSCGACGPPPPLPPGPMFSHTVQRRGDFFGQAPPPAHTHTHTHTHTKRACHNKRHIDFHS